MKAFIYQYECSGMEYPLLILAEDIVSALSQLKSEVTCGTANATESDLEEVDLSISAIYSINKSGASKI